MFLFMSPSFPRKQEVKLAWHLQRRTRLPPAPGAKLLLRIGNILGVLELNVAVLLDTVEEVLVMGSLLECRRHEVVLRLPLLLRIRDLLAQVLSESCAVAILIGSRDGVEENRGGDNSEGKIGVSLCQLVNTQICNGPDTIIRRR